MAGMTGIEDLAFGGVALLLGLRCIFYLIFL